ncbi:HDL364Wp [Eremothecium sinecaudum]|uniref:HDL364Wp n=1 Tax=Eremothecium sinecaudum TaxID=45286 RepID=A0A0X8HRZ1_9SACH|nr:HDL364Wp [Eremothecium sinecaudum]AMD20380.1 HDL364Wp [Eremothecium sinecaudum]
MVSVDHANSVRSSTHSQGDSCSDSSNAVYSQVTEDGSNIRRQTRKKFACVECRQQKSKCDSQDRAPEPCTRCMKKKVPCILQRDFRRTYKRARNEVIERRFNELTKSLSNLDAEEILKKIEKEQKAISNAGNFTKDKIRKLRERGTLELEVPDDDQDNLEQERTEQEVLQSFEKPVILNDEQLKCSAKSLGSVHVSSEDISRLFCEYAKRYHPFLPIVDLYKGPERIYHLSPCLFWIIILIGLRRMDGAEELMTKLSSEVKSIFAGISFSPINRSSSLIAEEPILNAPSVYSVQALLVYTFWPPVTSSLGADISWNTIGSAMFQAIHQGLNNVQNLPESPKVNLGLIQEQLWTWACCNTLSQTIASSFGFQAFVCFDYSIMRSRDAPKDASPGVPRFSSVIMNMIDIAYFENQVAMTMASNPHNPTGLVNVEERLNLIQLLDTLYNELKTRLDNNNVDDIRIFMLLAAKVRLYSYYFNTVTPEKRSSTQNTKSRDNELKLKVKSGLVRAYYAAVKLLHHTESMCDRDPEVINSFPSVFVLNVWQASCIVAKLANSSLSEMLDIKTGEHVYRSAVTQTLHASVLNYDMAYRSSGIMRSMWSMYVNMYTDWRNQHRESTSSEEFNLDITIKSRMSVSVFFDCLYVLRLKCGLAKLKREIKRRLCDSSVDSNSADCEDDREPELLARRLIETTPLDPKPINASMEGAKDPMSLPVRSVLKCTPSMTHKAHSEPAIVPPLSAISPLAVSISSDYSKPTYQAQKQVSTTQPKDYLQSFLLSSYPSLEYEREPSLEQAQFPDQTHTNSLENSIFPNNSINSSAAQTSVDETTHTRDNWDNWESEIVFKDVDLLMAEFAFNPSVI